MQLIDSNRGRTRGTRQEARATVFVALAAAMVLAATACIPQGTWTATMPAPIGISPAYAADFRAVSCPTPTFCMAVGEAGEGPTFAQDWTQPVVQIWDGTSWTDISASFTPLEGPDGADFRDVSCASATSCLVSWNYWEAPDFNARISGWNGTAFTTAQIDIEGVSRVACANGSTCYGTSEGYPIVSWDGTSFHTSATAYASDWSAVDCVTGTACFAYGFDGLERFDGTTWTPISNPSAGIDVSSIDCPTTTMCVAVGSVYTPATPTQPATTRPAGSVWDGTSWSSHVLDSDTDARFTSVSCVGPAECVTVGAGTDYIRRKGYLPVQAVWFGFGWAAVGDPPGNNRAYRGVSCPPGASEGCMGVGGRVGNTTSTLSAARFTWPHP